MDIQKGNKLIAEFMGWVDYNDHSYFNGILQWHNQLWKPEGEHHDPDEFYSNYLWEPNTKDPTRYRKIDELKYHKNWHWLIPVVKKIRDLDIDHEFSQVQENDVFDALVELDIEHLWQQTVNYIKWYNENFQS